MGDSAGVSLKYMTCGLVIGVLSAADFGEVEAEHDFE